MTTVQEIYETIDAFAPFASQESWDNSGLLAGAGTQPAEKILTTLDISQGVIAEAAAQGVQLIVSHHPVIFSPLKALPVQHPVYQLAAHQIAAICVHTPLDMAPEGLNAYAHTLLRERLSLEGRTDVLEPCWKDGRGFGWTDRACSAALCGIPPRKRPFGRSPIAPALPPLCWNWLRHRAAMR